MKSTILIEKYLDGTLKGEKLKDFIHQLQRDSELQELVALHREVNDSIREEDISRFKNKLNKAYLVFRRSEGSGEKATIHDIRSPGKKHTVPNRMLLVAAGITIIFIIGILFYKLGGKGHTGDKMYSMYYHPYVSDITVRSEAFKIDEIGNAILLYNKGRYKAAYDNFMHIVDANSENYLARFYLGLTCMELNRFDVAIRQFKNILDNCKSPVIYHAQWYLALCYLKTNNKREAEAILEAIISADTYYRIKAEELLDKLD
jgi:tetratricopeptide (TPR) repeat protein